MARKMSSRKPAAPDARLLTREQVAGRLGVSVVTIDRWTKQGVLHPVNLFELRRMLFAADEIDEVVTERACRRDAS